MVKQEYQEGSGAAWVNCGLGRYLLILLNSPEEVDDAVRRLRRGIEDGDFEAPGSYVSRWNPETKKVTIAAGAWAEPLYGCGESTRDNKTPN